MKVNWKLILDPLVVSDSGGAGAWNLDRTGMTGPGFDPILSGLSSYPSGKQWAAVRTQQDEIRLPPQRNTFSLDLARQNMAATHGWDSTVATVPPTIFICFLLRRCPHVVSIGSAEGQLLSLEMRHENDEFGQAVELPVAGWAGVGGAWLGAAK